MNQFNIKNEFAPDNLKFDNYYKYFKKKFLIKIDALKNKKTFLIESNFKYDRSNKIANHMDINHLNLSDIVYLQGNFENQSYFKLFKEDLTKLFTIKNSYIDHNKDLINHISKTNAVSIHVRQNRFSDQKTIIDNVHNLKKSIDFTNQTLLYIDRSIKYFNSNFDNITFFVWSNDFANLEEFFSKYNNNFVFIKQNNTINDFNLFKYAKHFIVGPSTFHWWGAWLNSNPDKICLRPKDKFLNPSNNKDFWPKNWIEI